MPHDCSSMLHLFRAQRILLYAGRVWDPDALLLSVLKHQTSTLPTHQASTLPKTHSGCQKTLLSTVSSTREDSQADQVDDPSSEDYRLFFDDLVSDERRSSALRRCQLFKLAQSASAAALPSDLRKLSFVQSEAAANSAAGQVREKCMCFTLISAEANPTVTFPEILAQWESFLEGHGGHYAKRLSPSLQCPEAALLNLKLEDPVLGQLAAMRSAPHLLSGVPKAIADVLRFDAQRETRLQQRHDPTWSGDGLRPLACYGLPHFSAELGDMGYLHSLLRQYPRGFPLRRFSTPSTHDRLGRDAEDVPDFVTWPRGHPSAAEPMNVDAAPQMCRSPEPSLELYSFEWVAVHCPDHFGLYLSHLAAQQGHIAYMKHLIDALGAAFVLQEQRCVPPISPSFVWGPQRYMSGLNATESAVAGQQVTLLEWIEGEYPSVLQSMHTKTTMRALLAAAMSPDDQTRVFDFFLTRNMSPISALCETRLEGLWAERMGVRGVVGGVSVSKLQESGILQLLFAAAEVGNAEVLQWFDEALGEIDVRRLCDSHGVTILHHCARGHNAQLLEMLLPSCARGCDAALDVNGSRWSPLNPLWVDMEDDQGRTPAMWCVMSAGRTKGVIETLEVLRRAGSKWPQQRQDSVSLLNIAARLVSRHSRLVRYLRVHIRSLNASITKPEK